MKNNLYKRDYQEDKFARKYYCTHARLGQLRNDKKQSRRKTRNKGKEFCRNYEKYYSSNFGSRKYCHFFIKSIHKILTFSPV